MAAQAPLRPIEVIDLVSSDDDNVGYDTRLAPRSVPQDLRQDANTVVYRSPTENERRPDNVEHLTIHDQRNHDNSRRGTIINIDGEEIYIPDDEDEVDPFEGLPQAADDVLTYDRELAMALGNEQHARENEPQPQVNDQEITADDCLARVLEIFPDINHEYVHDLFQGFDQEGDYEVLPGTARLDNIMEQLVSSTSYPKQEKRKKRKREASVTESQAKKFDQEGRAFPYHLKGPIAAILKAEFPYFPKNFINATMLSHKSLYGAFIALAQFKDDADSENRAYGKGRASSSMANAVTIATNCSSPELVEELTEAQKRVEARREEEANVRKAKQAGETAECSACFDDLPLNRQIHCNGPEAHFTCFGCAETYIKTQIGDSSCNVSCPSGCGAGFAQQQLNLLADKSILQKLSQLQQEKDIREADLEDLEECPFCDYKAILPPIEEDFEFRCANPECEKVSCRRCKAISHVPISCDEHAKENKLSSRHKVEEAMTAALIRACKKCKNQFIKELGCNKMTCPTCRNVQCYVCSETVTGYDHFEGSGHLPVGGQNTGKKKCPLHDNVEERHEREVKEAEAAARAAVVADNPDVTVEDLEIKVSDAVKKATADRVRHAGGLAAAMAPFGLDGVFPQHLIPPPHRRAYLHYAEEDDDILARIGDRERHGRELDDQLLQLQRERRQRLNELHQMRQDNNARRQHNLLAHEQNLANIHAQNRALRLAQPMQVQGFIPVVFGAPNVPAQQPQPVLAPNNEHAQRVYNHRPLPRPFYVQPAPQHPGPNQPLQAAPFRRARAPAPPNYPFGLDGAADENLAATPNAAGQVLVTQQLRAERDQLIAQRNIVTQQNQQPFNGQIRNHRQGFQELERLRQQHNDNLQMQQMQQMQQTRPRQQILEEKRRREERTLAQGLQHARTANLAADMNPHRAGNELMREFREFEHMQRQQEAAQEVGEAQGIMQQFDRFAQQVHDAQRQQ